MTVQATYVIRPEDLGKLEKGMAKNFRLEQQRMLRLMGRQAVTLLRVKSQHIRDLGGFQNGWRATPRFSSVDVENIAPNAVFVENGRRAGAKPPPVMAIMGWVLRHIGDARAAWPIARLIGERGIAARQVLTAPDTQLELQAMAVTAARAAWKEVVKAAR